ncbi:MAG TPA: hypothetical protein ENI27_04545 [bacterium]|nr:hypothetical protein [bacterium]
MPNGREYESPLNKLADSLPGFILEMQRVKVRQDAYEALNTYRQERLAATIERDRLAGEAREAIKIEKERRGLSDPPVAKKILDEIFYNRRTLSNPDITLTLGDDQIIKRWKNLKNQEADFYGRFGRDVSSSMPVTVEDAMAREKEARRKEDTAQNIQAAPPKGKAKKVTLEDVQRGRSLLEAGLGATPVVSPQPPVISEDLEIPEGVLTPTTQAEYDAIPPGTEFWNSDRQELWIKGQ